MTDAAYQAQEWINRTVELHEEIKKLNTAVKINESIVNNAVGKYQTTGRGKVDPIVLQQQREDALLEYSMLLDKVEKAERKLVKEELITVKVLEQMKNRLNAAILFDRYLNRITWGEMVKTHRFGLGRAQLFRKHAEALEELSGILNTDKIKEIPSIVEKEMQETRKKLRQQATA